MKKIVAVLSSLMMLLLLFGCQSTSTAEATEVVVSAADAPAAEAPAPAPAPAPLPVQEESEAAAPSEDAVTAEYEYLGYTLTISAADGKATVSYPEWVSNDDASAFFASEVAKYGAELDGVLYMFTAPGTVEIAYPVGVPADV